VTGFGNRPGAAPDAARPRKGYRCHECGLPNGRVPGVAHKWWVFDAEGYPTDLCEACYVAIQEAEAARVARTEGPRQ